MYVGYGCENAPQLGMKEENPNHGPSFGAFLCFDKPAGQDGIQRAPQKSALFLKQQGALMRTLIHILIIFLSTWAK